ncbi:FxSxx-COOH cyclophane-containing RiPP peptide [Actinoalloteichus caeruleus]|uniref:FxSxx-COOH cyclophane-containing RiPP peptide n=1 Tax=Actinoalloteichus cyanogriseus TaxID=2893586 RepID=UPI0004C0FA02|nr:FxSxx-COOH cyclophane-containing RiPP peptide [Actinoalloteichus caeruleus]
MWETDARLDSGLVDLTDIRLDHLCEADDSVLVNSLRRVLREIASPRQVLADFDNEPPGPPLDSG